MKKKAASFRSFTFVIMCVLTGVCIIAAVKNNIFRDRHISLANTIIILGLIFVTLLSGFLFARNREASVQMRYFTLFLLNVYASAFFFALTTIHTMQPHHSGLITILYTLSSFFTMALFFTMWLYQKQFLKATAITRTVTVLISLSLVVYAVVLIINLFRPVLFLITEEGIPSPLVVDYFSIFLDLFCLAVLTIATFSSHMNMSRKFSFVSCIFIPVLFVVLSFNQELMSRDIYIWGIVITTVLLPLCLIFYNAHYKLEEDVLRHEKEQIDLQVSAMISQMQPHFLYNSLAVIAALCEEDPPLAAKATNAFSDYLRKNMNFADKSDPIPFSEELSHVKTYVWLEKLRFPNKLTVEYDIRCTLFQVPALTVQPMVENAIKHGICKNRAGGTVRIGSFETDLSYIVTISDDGIGFDTEEIIDDERQHLGIKNTRYRIQKMMGGSLEIISTPQKGTAVTITLPKRSRI